MRENAPSSANGGDSTVPSRFEAFIGPRWSTYRTKLKPFFDEPSFVPTWNWPAALFGPFWFLYRKLYLGFLLFWFAPGVALRMLAGERADVPLTPATAALPENRGQLLLQLGVVISCAIAAGGTANYFLWRRGRAALAAVDLQQLPDAESLALIRRVGGVSRTMLFVSLAFALGVLMVAMAAVQPGASR
jgi:hypothetical protein